MPEETYSVVASKRRRRTMSVSRKNGRLVVSVPASMSRAARSALIPDLVERFLKREKASLPPRGDDDLTERARALYFRHARPHTGLDLPACGVRWVTNQDVRWGSCTPSTGEIRISDRLQTMPSWVVDFVLFHETLHLIESGHSAQFRAWEALYPRAERAEGFLEGVQHAGKGPA